MLGEINYERAFLMDAELKQVLLWAKYGIEHILIDSKERSEALKVLKSVETKLIPPNAGKPKCIATEDGHKCGSDAVVMLCAKHHFTR
jgi:hypothetical protein